MNIQFSNLNLPFSMKGKMIIKKWIRKVVQKENRIVGSIHFIFCSDEELQDINMKYLAHEDLTDIITFDYTDNEVAISGDMFISIERVKDNASVFGISFEEELRRVIIHGVLHLLGYADKSEEDAAKMRLLEDNALAIYLEFI